jgi:hypothetical protein
MRKGIPIGFDIWASPLPAQDKGRHGGNRPNLAKWDFFASFEIFTFINSTLISIQMCAFS